MKINLEGLMCIDLNKPVTIRGYTGTIYSLEPTSLVSTYMYYDVELVDLTPDRSHIMLRKVSPDEINSCV